MTISIYAYTYFWAIIFISIFYLLGSLALFLAKSKTEDDYTDLFIKLLIGLSSISIFYALYKTQANTIFLGVFIVIIFALKTFKKPELFTLKEAFSIKPKILIEFIAVFSFSFLFSCYFLFIDNNQIGSVYLDYIYFANLSDFLNFSGTESSYIDYFSATNKPQPYHYFEIWLNALLSKVSGISSVLTQQFVAHSIFFVLVFLGFKASLLKLNVSTKIATAAALMLPFFHGLVFTNYYPTKLLHPHYEIFLTNAITEPKLYPVYLFFIAAILAFLYERTLLALLILLVLPLVSIVVAPGIILGLIIFSITLVFFKQPKLPPIKILAATVLIAAFLFLFYYLNQTFHDDNYKVGHHFQEDSLIQKIVNVFSDFDNIQTLINIQAKTFLQEFYLYFVPFFAIVFIFVRAKKRMLTIPFLLFIILFFSFTFSWAFMDKMVDSSQLYTVAANPLINIVVIMLFLYAITLISKATYRNILTVFMLFLYVFPVYRTIEILAKRKTQSAAEYSLEYKNTVSAIVKERGLHGGFITNPKIHHGIIEQSLSASAHRYFMSYVKNQINVVPLHHFSEFIYSGDSNLKLAAENMQRETLFSKFLEKQKAENKFSDISQTRIDFINEYKLEFLFATRYAKIDSTLFKRAENIIADSKSGELFILLKKQ